MWFGAMCGNLAPVAAPGAWLARRAVVLALCIGAGAAQPTGAPSSFAMDAELARDLLGWAARLSGQPAPARLPEFLPLPPERLAAKACPRQPGACRTLVALYDTDRARILYRDTLDMRDPTDQSFIVHELVHHLQHLARGDALFATCSSALEAEAQAYAAQNRYLAHFRQWQRAGAMLRFTHCHHAGAEPRVEPSGVVLTGRSPWAR